MLQLTFGLEAEDSEPPPPALLCHGPPLCYQLHFSSSFQN